MRLMFDDFNVFNIHVMMAYVDMARKPAPAGFQLLCGEMYVLSLIKRLQYHESQFSDDVDWLNFVQEIMVSCFATFPTSFYSWKRL